MQTILDRALRVNTMKFLILTTSIFIFITIPAQSASSCKPDSCDSNHGPIVRFPFRLKNRQTARCGYPGFDLYCNSQNQTIVNLPMSGKFIVDYIDYKNQRLLIDDPGSCLANRALNFSLSGSPFQVSYFTKFTYLNCSGDRSNEGWSDDYILLFCLSDRNNTVLASSPAATVPPRCRRVANVSVPPVLAFARRGSWSMELKQDFVLDWSRPDCGKCENRGGICGYKGDSSLEIGCSKPSGLSRIAKYALTIGVGIPGLLCMIGFACYTWGKIKYTRHQHRQNSDIPITTIFNQRPSIRASGLDLPTIESYPKTVLGQSCRLPKPSDNTCLICLCEYQPKESLRSIPNCNHYFHVDCIDEWLKLNGTCPICRDSSVRSSISISFSTPLSSSSPSSSSSVTMNHQLGPTH